MPVSNFASTPLRRSVLRPHNDSINSISNDDEAERTIRRRTLGPSNAINTPKEVNLVEEQEGLKHCLKIFHDNKINKENAWTMTLIDNLSTLIAKHHKTLKNFQIVGSTLEATSKIYGLRVDSVHMDVIRMSSGLGRFKQSNNDDEIQMNDENVDAGDDTILGEPNAQPKPVKKKRVRKQISTITKNKETLNGKLDTMAFPDPLFSKLNSIMGDVSSSTRLLLNILQTDKSSVKLTLDNIFWDSSTSVENLFNEDGDNMSDQSKMIDLPFHLDINARHKIRQQLSGYLVTNTLIDDDDEDILPIGNNSFNQSQLDYAFDINAEVEPEPGPENHFAMDCDMDDGGGVEDFTNEDRTAINACKALRRSTTIVEDLRPSDTAKLEYSYRPMDNITQFWAGPSYWKFRKSRKLTIGSNTTAGTVVVAAVASRPPRRKLRINVEPKFYEDIAEMSDGESNMTKFADEAIFISDKSKAALKFKKTNLYKKWDSKKLKLPTDLKVDRHLFDYYQYAPGFRIQKNDAQSIPNTQSDAYNYDNGDDREYSANASVADDMDLDRDGDQDMDDHVPQELEMDAMIPADSTVQEIGQNFEGAPQMVEKIDIQFAKRAKVIDMTQMKKCCLLSINKQCEKTANRQYVRPHTAQIDETYKEGVASFCVIYNNLPNMLSKMMTENLTPSVAFYSILHLANEHRLRLYKSTKTDDSNVFLIREIE